MHFAQAFGELDETGAPQREHYLPPQSAWRLAADWTEVFSPVLWALFDAEQREKALTRRAHDKPAYLLLLQDVASLRFVRSRQVFDT